CLRGGKRPDRAIPLALADAVRAEARMAALGCRDPERCPESLRINELGPGILITLARLGEIVAPGNETDRLARIGQRPLVSLRFEESSFAVPEILLHEMSQRRRLAAIRVCQLVAVRQQRDLRNRGG